MLQFIGEVVLSGSILFMGPGQACWTETIMEAQGLVVTTEIKCLDIPPKEEALKCVEPHLHTVKGQET